MIPIIKQNTVGTQANRVWVIRSFEQLPDDISSEVKTYLQQNEEKDKQQLFHFNKLGYHEIFVKPAPDDNPLQFREQCRIAGADVPVKSLKIKEITLISTGDDEAALYLAEGMVLAAYTFDKYKSKGEEHSLEKVFLVAELDDSKLEHINISNEAVWHCRNLGNEPQSVLNAPAFAERLKQMGEQVGASVDVFNKRKIESLKMGGLLAVNKGSETEPAFVVMEWKPEKPVNKKAMVLVGKGVVFDTGGLNIKTGEFMYDMKLDMAGAAAAATGFWAVAKAALPVHVLALIPITDNRPGKQAYAPGDVLTMHNGKTVEVINTDAEGRLILADALSYARRYEPELVIDLATLTGAAARAIGKYGIVAMRNEKCEALAPLAESGKRVFERLVEFPLWKEYAELIKSDVADIKNLGGAEAGAITAGKFLENFVDYPWIHLDIAGPSILASKDSYRSKGASGVGTRLLFDFITNLSKTQK